MERSRKRRDGPARRARDGGRVQRALTYLAPGIPLEFFQLVTAYLARTLDCEIELEAEGRISGPMHGDTDPFAAGLADIGFVCSPSYLYLLSRPRPSIELVPAGFVFHDERARGEPVYFSDVVVRADHRAASFEDLSGCAWAYNDECSLSGHFAAQQKLAEIGCAGEFFERRVRTGSHDASIEAILDGTVDGAAIDSTVLGRARRERADLRDRLRVVDSFGPFPVQPIVIRRALGSALANRVADALLRLHEAHGEDERLRALGFERCTPIDDAAYAEERRALCALGEIPAPTDGDRSR